MSINQPFMNKKPLNIAGKLTWSTLGLSAVLALSACSGDKAVDEPVVEPEAPAAEVVEEPVVEEAPIVEEEPVVEEVPAEETAATDTEVAGEPEVVLAADAGAKLYESNCKLCHENGLLEAPKYGNKTDWEPRLAKGIDTLHMHSAKGFNQMPAQASDTVSEAEVYAAVDYMVAAVS